MSLKNPIAFDRLVGLSKPPSKDELAGCNDPQAPWHNRDPAEFERVWCGACKNTECVRSSGSKTSWVERMRDQPDYLINDPIFSDLLSHAHKALAAQDFPLRNAQAERLEISSQQQDWSVPAPGAVLVPQGRVVPDDPHAFDDPPEEPEVPLPEPDLPQAPAPLPTPKPVPVPKPSAKPANTPMPKGGFLLGPASAPAPPVDPWTPTTSATMVLPGAKVVLK